MTPKLPISKPIQKKAPVTNPRKTAVSELLPTASASLKEKNIKTKRFVTRKDTKKTKAKLNSSVDSKQKSFFKGKSKPSLLNNPAEKSR